MVKRKSPDEIKEKILKFVTEKRRFVEIKEICRELKMSRPTIRKYLNDLAKEGWLEEEK